MILGVDEVGRGSIAGPVVSAAVILGENKIFGLKDSKDLSEQKRIEVLDNLYSELLSKLNASKKRNTLLN